MNVLNVKSLRTNKCTGWQQTIRKVHSCFELRWAKNDNIKQFIHSRHLLETLILTHPPPLLEKAQKKIIVITIMISYLQNSTTQDYYATGHFFGYPTRTRHWFYVVTQVLHIKMIFQRRNLTLVNIILFVVVRHFLLIMFKYSMLHRIWNLVHVYFLRYWVNI